LSVRLKQIKLSGFKSFVDPTSFEVPGRLVGIVGPNGCGKSNIIDAVRWVLGETKASELRGESMQDVIFSGSVDRKPSGRASVELVFDNALGRLGGPWAQYAEISVRRVLGRDGQSTYSINNQIVRRRDVHDLFLGTGLGPRAYAIIGQGMISRIIESRPEELRVFLEEAAGVSRYRERRKETESRLQTTRENLNRVEDIQRELEVQVERLGRQAELARQYRELESERERKQRWLWLLRRDEAVREQTRLARAGAELVVGIEGQQARLREVEAEIETVRSAHYAAGDEVHAAQARFYEANAEVARIEAEIRLVANLLTQTRERLQSVQAQSQRESAQLELARATIEDGQGRGIELAEQSEASAAVATQLADQSPVLEDQLREQRNRLEESRLGESEISRRLELNALSQRNAQQTLDALQARLARLQAERRGLVAVDDERLNALREDVAVTEASEEDLAAELSAQESSWSELDGQRLPAQQRLRDSEARLARVDARLSALRHLQSRLESQSRVQPWLAKHGLERLARLYPKLRIESGWENAVEAILREKVNALELATPALIAGLAHDPPPGKLAFFEARVLSRPAGGAVVQAGLRPMIEIAHCPDAAAQSVLAELLSGCFIADSLESAIAERDRLPEAGRFVVREGHQIGRSLFLFHAPDSEQEGVLARLHEIDNLSREQRAEQLLVDEARSQAVAIEAAAADALERLGRSRERQAQTVRRLAQLRLELNNLEQQASRVQASRERIDAELAELTAQHDEAEGQHAALGDAFEQLDADLAQAQQLVEDRQQDVESAEAALTEHRERLRQAEREAQEIVFELRANQAQLERLAAQVELTTTQLQSLAEEAAVLEERIASVSDAEVRSGLQAALERRSVAESALASARARLDELTQTLRSREDARLMVERDQQPLRDRLTELQLQEQAARLSAEQYSAQLMEAGLDEAALQALCAELSEAPPRPSWLQGELTRLANAIAALGPVNLAALDELAQASERQQFLKAQSDDLNEAIATLEDAIRRIDRETRDLLRETYDTVNRHFGELFPRLFGGGEARLILTGEEILDAGIQVMAQPPGKRNTSIHLLSGGEKALTAIALVFALFQLNPAPFCLLDEVDAPLDDANTERYADMVRAMSAQTQFLFISHNKLAMEIAEQLIGVTMQEKGVSRIVAVDLQAATRLAEAA
jgi:chromosome segregation protein